MNKLPLSFTGLLFSLVAFSQNTPAADSSLKEVKLNEITVSATRFAEDSGKIPQQIQILNAKKSNSSISKQLQNY
jgi:hypothetical protein